MRALGVLLQREAIMADPRKPKSSPMDEVEPFAIPEEEPQSLFKIERREVIGEVFSDPWNHGKPPIITAFQIIGEHINNMTENGDRSFAKFEFEYDGQGFTVERETFPPTS
jgi:hypothetical protein